MDILECSCAYSSSYQVACDSLSQASDQVRGVTLSPNHWCASSWIMIASMYQRGYCRPVNSRSSKRDSVWVSSSKPVSAWASSMPYVSKGYWPTLLSIQVSWPGVFASHGSRRLRSAAGTTSRSGRPRGPVRRTTAERPMDTCATSVAMGWAVR